MSSPSLPQKQTATIAELRHRFFNQMMDENLNPRASPSIQESQSLRSKAKCQLVAKFREQLETVKYIRTKVEKPLRKDSKFKCAATQLFAPLKPLQKLYETIISKHLDLNLSSLKKSSKPKASKIESSNSASPSPTPSQQNEEDDFERSIASLFCGKLGIRLEASLIRYCVQHRSVASVDLMTQLDEKYSKLVKLDDQKSGAELSLSQLLDSVTQFAAEFPPFLDQLLQETPLNSTAYQELDRALVFARGMAKNVADAKEILAPSGHYDKKPGILGAISRWFRSKSR